MALGHTNLVMNVDVQGVRNIRAAAERALGFFDGHYQADLVSKLPLYARSPT